MTAPAHTGRSRPPAPSPTFDRIARPYRTLEHLTLGRSLERCREHFLTRLSSTRHALVLGEGDGRFLSRLLAANPDLHAHAVDLSPRMLDLLRRRCSAAVLTGRLLTHTADALRFVPPPGTPPFDLVVTHFFLDCLTDNQLNALTQNLVPTLSPGALWLVSDFRIPPRGPLRLPARLLVRGLYLAFRLLTGLRTTHLPDHATALTSIGLHPIAHHHSLGGLLTTELWQLSPRPHL